MNTNGILIVDKPCGITSFGVVSFIKKCFHIKKVGHMGTLDPMATGVLPIMLGKATKVLDLVKNNNKKYIAKIKFGISTDTQDTTGEILSRSKKAVNYSEFNSAINNFIGEIYQIPPMYSAIKKNGVKLYELARRGETTEREKRKVSIDSIKIIEFDAKGQEATIAVNCSKGTYIRTLCNDIGSLLGCGAAMSYLRRVESNGFKVEESLSLNEIENLIKSGGISEKIISISSMFSNLKNIFITPKQKIRFKNGGGLSLDRLSGIERWEDRAKYSVYESDEFIGLGIADLGEKKLLVYKLLGL